MRLVLSLVLSYLDIKAKCSLFKVSKVFKKIAEQSIIESIGLISIRQQFIPHNSIHTHEIHNTLLFLSYYHYLVVNRWILKFKPYPGYGLIVNNQPLGRLIFSFREHMLYVNKTHYSYIQDNIVISNYQENDFFYSSSHPALIYQLKVTKSPLPLSDRRFIYLETGETFKIYLIAVYCDLYTMLPNVFRKSKIKPITLNDISTLLDK